MEKNIAVFAAPTSGSHLDTQVVEVLQAEATAEEEQRILRKIDWQYVPITDQLRWEFPLTILKHYPGNGTLLHASIYGQGHTGVCHAVKPAPRSGKGNTHLDVW
jgi:hypothetical protein